MTCSFTTKPRWARRKDARPQELLAAALTLFVERGYAATRLDDVAAEAGVSKGTLYLYFTNKEELFKAVVRENVLPVIDEAEDMIERFEGSSQALLQRIMQGWWQRIGNTRLSGITKLMMAESGNFPEVAQFYHDEIISRYNRLIRNTLMRGMARDEFCAMDVENATHVVVAPMLMLTLWKHSFAACRPQMLDTTAYFDCYVDLLLNGLLKTRPAPALESQGNMIV